VEITATNQAISTGRIELHVEIAFGSETATWPTTSQVSNN